MPNFPPLRRHVFSVVDRWIRSRGLEAPFLEVGCGTGELASHLSAGGWRGVALDSSPSAVARARVVLAGNPRVELVEGDLGRIPARDFRTVFLMDVIEHVSEDSALLRELAGRLVPGGFLVMLTPVNPGEWGPDDEVYGHFHRYAWEEVGEKLAAAGFTVVERRNVTVPFIWLLRRIYLKVLPRRIAGGPMDRLTAASSYFNPWDESPVLRVAGAVLGLPLWWAPLFWIQDRFAGSKRGHAAMFLARKNGGEGK